jgi:hypothetical protein
MPAFDAAKMDVLVVVIVFGATSLAKGVFHAARVVDYPVDEALLLKRFERAVNGYPVKGFANEVLNLGVGQGVAALHKNIEHGHPHFGAPHMVSYQYLLEVMGVAHRPLLLNKNKASLPINCPLTALSYAHSLAH